MNSRNDDVLISLALSRDPAFFFAMKFLQGAGFDLLTNGQAARDWCLDRAALGDTEGQYVSAVLLGSGLFGPTCREEAVIHCRKAADAGYAPAILLLGTWQESGWGGLHPNSEEAVGLMERSAGLGFAPAMHALALYYLDKHRDLQSRQLAIKYLRQAAELGDANAQFTLAKHLLSTNRPSQAIEGLEYMRRSAEQLNPHAHEMLGYFLRDGRHGVVRDKSQATFHFDKAKELEEESWKGLIGPAAS